MTRAIRRFVPGLVATCCVAAALAVQLTASDNGLRGVPCFIPHFNSHVRCIAVRVPVDWEHPSRTLTVAAAVVPALGAGDTKPPLLVLPGGPGQAGTDLGAMIDTAFAHVRNGRDIVLFDPRGMGRSTRFSCAIAANPNVFNAAQVTRIGVRCAPKATAVGLDPALSTIAKDVDALRAALGISQFDVWGGSYGTKYAQAYAQLYPTRVRRMVLDGTVPINQSILSFAAVDADRAWNDLVRECAADDPCDAAYPDLDEMTMSLLRRAAARPLRERIANPANGQTDTVAFDRMALSNVIRGALYVPQFARMLPYAISHARRGDLSGLAALNAAGAAWSTDTMALGATAAVMCSEEAPPARRARIQTGRLIADSYAEYWLTLCRNWPEAHPPFHATPGRASDIPVLFLVGGLDPIAPLARGRDAARAFRNATIAVAPAGGHTISTLGCAPQLIGRFLDDPASRKLATACLRIPLAPPPFFVAN